MSCLVLKEWGTCAKPEKTLGTRLSNVLPNYQQQLNYLTRAQKREDKRECKQPCINQKGAITAMATLDDNWQTKRSTISERTKFIFNNELLSDVIKLLFCLRTGLVMRLKNRFPTRKSKATPKTSPDNELLSDVIKLLFCLR